MTEPNASTLNALKHAAYLLRRDGRTHIADQLDICHRVLTPVIDALAALTAAADAADDT